VHVSTPSADEFHYLHTDIGPKVKSIGSYFEYDVYKSPSLTTAAIAQAQERSGGTESEAWKREYLCQIIRTQSRMLLPEFDERVHVREFQLPSHYKPLIMIDSGGVRDKTGIIVALWDFMNGRMLVTNDAELNRGSSSSEIIATARFLEQELRGSDGQLVEPMRFADLPGLTQIDFIREHNYQVQLPHKTDRDANIAAARIALANQKILIHPRCIKTRSCCAKARWHENRKDIERTDEHGHADLAVALVYAWRMIDRNTNPFPVEAIHTDTQLIAPYRSEKPEMAKIASALVPFDPMRRAKGRR